MNTLTLAQTEHLINKAISKAELLNIMVNIAIVDSAGYLINFKRMDGAQLGPIDIAIKKAKTSALFGKPCHVLGEKSQPGGALYQIEQSNNGLITFAGGLPIFNANGAVVAAIGVSGSTIENDLVVAQAAIA
ncbi:GlcG/HbpS family heme-binding protein [Colwellia psychrerythraea]|uniref:Glycolate utilization protein n=1 Tax=Colwellia psychrerythraea TaxID=28229 RepID=A0A099K972_COLPS|nr:heme-binding protein [Colwellia psychrerythraea]KGJ86845.1 protein of unknown function DUF336 [Colwellia psychrerythraea]